VRGGEERGRGLRIIIGTPETSCQSRRRLEAESKEDGFPEAEDEIPGALEPGKKRAGGHPVLSWNANSKKGEVLKK